MKDKRKGNMNIRIAKEKDMPAVFALRLEVFVDEQGVSPELELDGEDGHALHIVAEEGGKIVGCARVLFSEKEAHIGRLAVRKNNRSSGVGSAICKYILAFCQDRGYKGIWLNAQCHSIPFYEKLGFCAKGKAFLDAGIEHKRMEIGDCTLI